MIWIITSWVLLAAGLLICLLALFWDRPGFRGRPSHRCRKCWYDLKDSGELPITCSECGKISKTEHSMRRVHRHKRQALLGVLLMLAAPIIGLTPAYQKGTLLSRLPSWVLIEMIPISPAWRQSVMGTRNPNHPGRELSRRMQSPTMKMTHQEFVDVVHRSAEGNIFAMPGSPRWVRTTGDWIGGQQFQYKDWKTDEMHYPDGTPADAALMDAFDRLANVLPAWNPETRAVWPEGEVMMLWSGYEYPRWPTGELYESATLIIRGHQEEPEYVEIPNFLNNFQLKARGQAGDHIECEITLNYHRVPKDWDWNSEVQLPSIQSEKFVISWDIVEEMEDAIIFVDSEAIREAMIVHTTTSVADELDGFDFHNDWLDPQFDRVGFGVIIQAFDADELLGQSEQRWMAQKGEWIGRIQSMMGTSYEDYLAYKARAADAISRGTLRFKIIGDPLLGMELIEAKKVWKGEIDILNTEAEKIADSYWDIQD